MNKTNKKECPGCKSKNVIDRKTPAREIYLGGLKTEKWDAIYRCKDCDMFFMLINP